MTKHEALNHARDRSQDTAKEVFEVNAIVAERESVEFPTDIDSALNEALEGTFPASDPISSLRVA